MDFAVYRAASITKEHCCLDQYSLSFGAGNHFSKRIPTDIRGRVAHFIIIGIVQCLGEVEDPLFLTHKGAVCTPKPPQREVFSFIHRSRERKCLFARLRI